MPVIITSVKQLNKQPSTASAQDPSNTTVQIVFRVTDPSLPRKTLKTYERKNNSDGVQCRHDKVKADRESRKQLHAGLSDCGSNGKLNLIIKDNKIVQKNLGSNCGVTPIVTPPLVYSVNSFALFGDIKNDEIILSDIISDKFSYSFVTADGSLEEEEEMSFISFDDSESY